jgi:hypothetical protein
MTDILPKIAVTRAAVCLLAHTSGVRIALADRRHRRQLEGHHDRRQT